MLICGIMLALQIKHIAMEKMPEQNEIGPRLAEQLEKWRRTASSLAKIGERGVFIGSSIRTVRIVATGGVKSDIWSGFANRVS